MAKADRPLSDKERAQVREIAGRILERNRNTPAKIRNVTVSRSGLALLARAVVQHVPEDG